MLGVEVSLIQTQMRVLESRGYLKSAAGLTNRRAQLSPKGHLAVEKLLQEPEATSRIGFEP